MFKLTVLFLSVFSITSYATVTMYNTDGTVLSPVLVETPPESPDENMQVVLRRTTDLSVVDSTPKKVSKKSKKISLANDMRRRSGRSPASELRIDNIYSIPLEVENPPPKIKKNVKKNVKKKRKN